ncbi:type II toxin-antitoxin system ParD family antitoxin [Agrobacterium rosae]|uniref:Type II toxin-antitoxin system ParD family antitoxin n=1 Tax=Agrobacterium rosae TaxID=1972867 RepID=A0AAE5RXZ9_9HYPH|nr:type II toxin-antitoxin system ParD family antitoxin [Agrobacterium rosae]KAA3514564.1 type II toxin-antitoxin system ParD family antitoxin [Agrobacterium rosae]KAA3523227.1 type II toxin-antitoxin system ParD family antitoxin [Agrobacterium rosae]MCM2433434.1 type II toxin-antitoxin system ParD family antitoxin [Agrobacterium rosae]MDX8330014.1 type II toxin-antitoxin system ParD family antitoxin [Agrobacterium rosae]MQB47974.1 type II toxin-antitoxin system ParD family antitoxin [Agrobact
MGKNTSVNLNDHFDTFIEQQIEQGRYTSASEVVRAGLRLLEEREAELSNLRAALVEGENSGSAASFDFDAFIQRKKNAG